ncbi:MAG: hypothetical protein RIG62_01010 [Cyclobacteriaceae bacterium]
MFGIEILEIVIGLIFVFLLLSLLATTLNEIIMQWLYSRGKNLHIALQTMLDDESDVLCEKFFEHPLIQKLKKQGTKGFPPYISNRYFSKVLTELLCQGEHATLDEIEAGIKGLPKGKTREVLLTFIRDAKGNLEQFKSDLEMWYQEVMNQATGWYKRRVQQVLFALGLILSIAFNADTFRIAQKLSVDPEARREIIDQAYVYMQQEQLSGRDTSRTIDSLRQQVRQLIDEEVKMASTALGMGWQLAPRINLKSGAWWKYIGQSLMGWIVTAFAITLGAPFWFDLLKRVMNIRASSKKPGVKEDAEAT